MIPSSLPGDVLAQQILLTNSCVDQAIKQLGQGTREEIGFWLRSWIAKRGSIVAKTPSVFGQVRSPSGSFVVVEEWLALPLRYNDHEPFPPYVATSCLMSREWLVENGFATHQDIDPFSLFGADLVLQINFSRHCIERFQERCNGNTDLEIARSQLLHAITPTARASAERPAWSRSNNSADFFLVADDEYCLPVQRRGIGGLPFEALTCLHRSMRLFDMPPQVLAKMCEIPKQSLDRTSGLLSRDPNTARELHELITKWGNLRFTPPPWLDPRYSARFYIQLDRRLVVPVSWYKRDRAPLLRIEGIHAEPSTLWGRIWRLLTGRIKRRTGLR